MNRIINIYTKVAAAVLAVTLAAGCVFEKEGPVNDAQLKSFMVQLGVTTDRGMTTTKASVEELEGIYGQGIENTIKTLRVYAYTGAQGSEKLCGYLYVKDVQGADSTTPKAYMMDIRLPYSQMDGKHNIIFKAVANAEAMMYPTADGSKRASEILNITELGRDGTGAFVFTGNLAFDTFDDILYDIPNQGFTATDGTVLGMPMYCVTEPHEIDLSQTMTNSSALNANDHLGHTPVKSVDINLTRSLAKIEVYAAEAADTTSRQTTSVKITEVSLANIPTSGNLFNAPEENAELGYGTGGYTQVVKNDVGLDVTKKVDETSDADIKNSDNYTKVMNAYYLAENNKGATPGTYEFGATDYLVENENATLLKIGYSVNGGEPEYGFVKMPPIERNTWYKVLARITAGGQMTLTFVAQQWNLVTEELTYDDNVSVTEGKIKWSAEPNDNAEVVTTGNDLSCEFTIATPSYATWHASFIPLEGDQNAFGFVTTDENLNVVTVPTFSGPVGSPAKLTIRPLVQNPTQTNKARLRIIVRTNEGRTIVVKNNILSGNTYSNDEYILIHSM